MSRRQEANYHTTEIDVRTHKPESVGEGGPQMDRYVVEVRTWSIPDSSREEAIPWHAQEGLGPSCLVLCLLACFVFEISHFPCITERTENVCS